jgi:hypothetical protein
MAGNVTVPDELLVEVERPREPKIKARMKW